MARLAEGIEPKSWRLARRSRVRRWFQVSEIPAVSETRAPANHIIDYIIYI